MSENDRGALAPNDPAVDAEAEFALPSGQAPMNGADEDAPSSDDRIWAGAAYLSQALVPVLVPAIMLVSENNKDRPFQKFHAIHALALFAISVIYEIVAAIVYAMLTAISAGCFGCILWPVFLVPIVALVYYAYLSYSGEYFEVPVLTEFLRDQDWI